MIACFVDLSRSGVQNSMNSSFSNLDSEKVPSSSAARRQALQSETPMLIIREIGTVQFTLAV